ncbi:MAG: GatB/YqeY domain-containing protein [Bacteriovoracaceae bacterium]|nr:GatB/YqeY domain-containing protein [Bacteriovoracaceae bacterium]
MLDQINDDIKSAMKSKDKEKLQALRYIKSMLTENKVAKKPIPEIEVVIKYHKKLNDSLSMYPDGHEMKEQASKEIKILETYLPKQMTEEEVSTIIDQIISTLENPNMGGVMKELSPQIKGKFDGKKASQLVIAKLK